MKSTKNNFEKGQIKSCFVSNKDLINDNLKSNHCKFCQKSLIDIRNLDNTQVHEVLKNEKEPCVISHEGQLEDTRSLKVKISDTILRAHNLFSGPRLIAYATFFVVMTVITSCQKHTKIGKIAPNKEKKDKKVDNPTMGFYIVNKNTNT